jgi:hypothetical protein
MKSFSRWVVITVAVLAGSALAQQTRIGDSDSRMTSVPIGPTVGFINRTPRLRTSVHGWAMTGTRTEAYEIRCDAVFTDCEIPILRTRTLSSEPFGMGSITHSESAVPWRDQRLEVSAELKAGGIDGWAGVWMRIDDANGKVLAFDNMQNRPVRGTTGFAWYSVVLDVPAEAARVTFGVVLHGPGAVFVRELSFQSIGGSKVSTDLVAPLRAQSAAGVMGG